MTFAQVFFGVGIVLTIGMLFYIVWLWTDALFPPTPDKAWYVINNYGVSSEPYLNEAEAEEYAAECNKRAQGTGVYFTVQEQPFV